MYVSLWAYAHLSAGTYGVQKKLLDPSDLELRL